MRPTPRQRARGSSVAARLLTGASFLWVVGSGSSVWGAAPCRDSDCPEHGQCDTSAVVPRCRCDAGYSSLSTLRDDGTVGAVCLRDPPRHDSVACRNIHCAPRGVCVEQPSTEAGLRGVCLCDDGYAAQGDRCLNDPEDPRESACEGIKCGLNATCVATLAGVTCRCFHGGGVVVRENADGQLGPVCALPPEPSVACGPDACGPYGTCRLGQTSAYCACADGAQVEKLLGSDNRPHPFCVDPRLPSPAPVAGTTGFGGASSVDAGPSLRRPATPGRAGCDLAPPNATPLQQALALVGVSLLLGACRRGGRPRAR